MKTPITLILLIFCIYSFGQKTKEKPKTPIIRISSFQLKTQITDGVTHYSFIKMQKKLYNVEYKIIERIENESTKLDSRDFRKKMGLFFKGESTGITTQGFFSHGYKNGFWKTEFNNKLVQTINYKNGLVIGRYRVYNVNGDLIYKTTFGSAGNGRYKGFYYKTGILKEEGNYQNGKKEGEWIQFNEQGDLTETIYYIEGMPKE